jgi:ADP-glucose pyrophosphorylase
VINSVVGRNVVINNPLTVKNSVILDGVRINKPADITNSLVAGDFSVVCDDLEVGL